MKGTMIRTSDVDDYGSSRRRHLVSPFASDRFAVETAINTLDDESIPLFTGYDVIAVEPSIEAKQV